jgi:CRISPR/Cas system CMR-associated protein Cmr5 small subunit
VSSSSLSNSGPSPSPSPGIPDNPLKNSGSPQKTPIASPVKPANSTPVKPMTSPTQPSQPSFSRGAASTLRHSVAGSHVNAPANGKSARRDMILIEIDNKDNEIMKAMKELEDLKKEKDRLFKFLASKREQLEAEMKKANEPKEAVEDDKKPQTTESVLELQKQVEQEEKMLRDQVSEQSKFVQMDIAASKPLFERITERNRILANAANVPVDKLLGSWKRINQITEYPLYEETVLLCRNRRPLLVRVRQKRVLEARDRDRRIREKYVSLVHKWKRKMHQQRQLRRQQKLEEEIKKQAAADRGKFGFRKNES